ncbi:transcriptional regulator [Methylovulum psychrotolerans]|uniref:Transcriptional regulator n=1 Tax=Methylovulum psychrotolerans TaxID=1704499 RepID=A0A1Z4C5D7_9GAMM|nr:transcriptional regulator [Methylovulum psychrotolerans]
MANAAAESYTDDTLDWVAEGKSFTSRTGQLEQSVGWRPLGDGSAEIYANAEYALYVEEGTRPHVILPKNGRALKIPTSGGGGYILRRKVNHPGTAPMPFFFADGAGREQRMGERALSVLAGVIEYA